MNSESLLALFSLKGPNDQLYATLRYPDSSLWAANQRVTVRPSVSGDVDGLPTICIAPESGSGFYTDFPVESATTDSQGRVVLFGKKGTAIFSTVEA